MKAASFLQVGDARLPERRAIEHREVRAARLLFDELDELAADRQRRRHHLPRIDGALRQCLLAARRQRTVEPVRRVAVAIDEVRQRRVEAVDDGDAVCPARERQPFAGRDGS